MWSIIKIVKRPYGLGGGVARAPPAQAPPVYSTGSINPTPPPLRL